MEFNLQTVHFNATEKLQEHIAKKVAKLEKNPDIQTVDAVLRVEKSESFNGKSASVRVKMPGQSIYVEKVADTFEEAIDKCIDIVRRGLEKTK